MRLSIEEIRQRLRAVSEDLAEASDELDHLAAELEPDIPLPEEDEK